MAFYYSYMKNKRKEVQFFDKYINLGLYDHIMEPFGGSCSFSRPLFDKDLTKNFIISKKTLFFDNVHILLFGASKKCYIF